MMETPLAMLTALPIAATASDAANRLACFVMGTNDLAKETRARFVPGRAPFLPWLQACLAAARAYGVDIVDGVFNGLTDETGFREECEQGRDLGFDGKTLIHPNQIAVANAVFAPGEAEVEWARRIIAAFAEPQNRDKARCNSTARWSSVCTPRWASAPSPSPRPSPRGGEGVSSDSLSAPPRAAFLLPSGEKVARSTGRDLFRPPWAAGACG